MLNCKYVKNNKSLKSVSQCIVINVYIFTDFFLHTFRKQKRVRTAFAPLQLLKLEHAFEGNQYVVGSERKSLAKSLNLSETQVIHLFLFLIVTLPLLISV